MRRLFLVPILALVLSAAGPVPPPGPQRAQALWSAWPAARVSPPDPWALKHAGLRAALEQLQVRHPGLFAVAEEGLSAEGRKIPLLRVGSGPTGVLLWSQMHGDEPTATAALLDVLNWLGAHRGEAEVRQLLSKLTLWIIPMLNPDGAERNRRWNAQEIDINRDALRLTTPEGRFLKSVRDRVRPVLGYNLHNQSPHLRAGRNGGQVAIALLAVPGDEAFSVTPGTRRTMRLAVAVQRLLTPFAAGRIARYDTDYTERAFGDAMTRWGTATLLIESGGFAGPDEAARLVRLNFVALLGSLAAIADGSLDALPVKDYAAIPVNLRDAMASLVVRNLRLAGGRGLPPFTADLAFLVPGPFAGDKPRRRGPSLHEIGDLSYARGLEELDGTGLLAVPWPADPKVDWATLRTSLGERGLAEADEAQLLDAVRSRGEAAVARPGFEGAVLLYRKGTAERWVLSGAVLHGRVVGEPESRTRTATAGQGSNATTLD